MGMERDEESGGVGKSYQAPFGRGRLTFSLPPAVASLDVIAAPAFPPLEDLPAAVTQALAHPLGAPRLRDLAQPDVQVCLVFTDATRACPDEVLVPALLAELAARLSSPKSAAGVPDANITLLCATGLHRASTPAEKIAKLGADIVARCRVVDHDAQQDVVSLGQTEHGIPLTINRVAAAADLLLATGVVEPHQYAGFSGGSKIVGVGIAGEPTIAFTHGPAMLDQPGARLGNLQGNPFQAAVREAGRRARLQFVLNVVLDGEGRALAVAAGAPDAVHDHLAVAAQAASVVHAAHPYDVIIAGVGFPKDQNFYQASRAATYVGLVERPALAVGGVVILPAPCPEGIGAGAGEQRFADLMRAGADRPALLLAEMRAHGFPPGAQRAFMLAQLLERFRLVVVGCETPSALAACHVRTAASIEDALTWAADQAGHSLRVALVPHALTTVLTLG